MPHETAARLLQAARARLRRADIDTAHLDARLLLQQALGISHETLIAEPHRPVSVQQREAFDALVERRLRREPVSRILGEREFYGRRFVLGPQTLDPRPDTETLIDAARPFMRDRSTLLDLGTGSGAIAITLLAEHLGIRATATDVSPQALEIAGYNAELHGVADRLDLRQSDWFSAVRGRFDLVVSNPPYIPSAEIAGLAPEVRLFDPKAALDGGSDGLDAYRRIASGTRPHLASGGHVLVEIGMGQAHDIAHIFEAAEFTERGRWTDLQGYVRCIAFA